jgi:hypothetical protein
LFIKAGAAISGLHSLINKIDGSLPPLPCFGYDVLRNWRSVSQLRKEELVKVDAQVDRLVREVNRSIAEADKFIQALEKEPA